MYSNQLIFFLLQNSIYLMKHDFINLLHQMQLFKKLELTLHTCVSARSGNPPARVTLRVTICQQRAHPIWIGLTLRNSSIGIGNEPRGYYLETDPDDNYCRGNQSRAIHPQAQRDKCILALHGYSCTTCSRRLLPCRACGWIARL